MLHDGDMVFEYDEKEHDQDYGPAFGACVFDGVTVVRLFQITILYFTGQIQDCNLKQPYRMLSGWITAATEESKRNTSAKLQLS